MPTQQQTLRNILGDDDTFTTLLLVVLIDTYGTEALQWSPETVIMELEDDYNVRLTKLNRDKIVVGMNLLTSDDFYKRPSRFVQMCNVLAGSELTPEFDKADAMECAWGLTEAMLLSPPEPDDENPFNEEIRHYLGRILDEEGIREPPDLLRLAIRDTPSGGADYGDMDTEDPSMFAAEYQVQADRSQEIKEMLEDGLQNLFSALASLPLKNGNVKDLLKRVQGRLQHA